MTARLGAPWGRWIDPSRPLQFSFEGKTYQGFAGDTIASALLGAEAWLMSRSFKFHRPRGPVSLAGNDANSLVQLPGEPNVPADLTALADGMRVSGQNYKGSLERDRRAVLDRLGRFLPAGFYYRAFFRPRGAWRFWEPMVRDFAGLGVVDPKARLAYCDKVHLFADVAIVGGGVAGLAAARAAAEADLDVLLIEQSPHLGGALNYGRLDDEGDPAPDPAELVQRAGDHANVRIMTGATCTGLFADNWLSVISGTRLFKVRARRVVIATGAVEQPMVFRNNDRPAVVLGSAVQRLLRLYGVRPGRRAVVATGNRHGYAVALDLADAGVDVAAVVDVNADGAASPQLLSRLRARDIRVETGQAIAQAVGGRRVEGVRLARLDDSGRLDGRGLSLDCDLLVMSAGYVPAAALICQRGVRLAYDPAARTLMPAGALPAGLHAAGMVAGAGTWRTAAAQGRRAGLAAAAALGAAAAGGDATAEIDAAFRDLNCPFSVFPHAKGRDFVDFDEDVEVKDLRTALALGYRDGELLKRFTTAGMGPSQGRLSALNALRITADLLGRDIAGLGATTVRPPARPERFGVLAGRPFAPERLTPMDGRHRALGATMMTAGAWWRPAYYGPPGARSRCIAEEARAVRRNVAMIDVSTLGGLEVRGPDAAEFMERIYTFAYRRQPIGRARYILKTDETGVIVDDGVACRLAEDQFYVTATTGAVDQVWRDMLWRNAEWRLDVDIANVTAGYAAINLAGPNARSVLAPLVSDGDIGATAFPYMAVGLMSIANVPCRVLRVGFVGELGYEIHCPWSLALSLWDVLTKAGRDFGLRPFGVEAQRLLRLEKGHIIVGQDTDGLTHPYEADMAWAIARRKPYFVGGRSLEIQNDRPLTRKLVGFTIDGPAAPVPAENQLVIDDGEIVGRVTSSAFSPNLERVIGLAYVPPAKAVVDQPISIKIADGRMVVARVVALPFYDPENERQAL